MIAKIRDMNKPQNPPSQTRNTLGAGRNNQIGPIITKTAKQDNQVQTGIGIQTGGNHALNPRN